MGQVDDLMQLWRPTVLALFFAFGLLACSIQDQAADCVNQGIAQAQKGEWQKAITSFTRALELKTQYQEVVHYNRGLAYANLGKMDQALADFNRVLALNPKDLEGYINRGRVYLIKGDFGRAISEYDQALKLNPKYLRAYIHRGLVYYQQGDWDRAFADLNRALELDPKDAEALYHQADLLDKAGKSKEAVAAYQSFLTYASPQGGDRYVRRARERITALEHPVGK
jgi:tetratricopeptide (TPR) repeat protein